MLETQRCGAELTVAPDRLPRAHGKVQLAFEREGVTRVSRRFQSGCTRVFCPRTDADTPQVVLVNTAGGLTGGDALSYSVRWHPRTEATVTSQAAERIYRSVAGDASIETTLDVDDGACAEWLPQETILFDGGRLRRSLSINMAMSARVLALEAVILGRTASGEILRSGRLRDAMRIRRCGRLIYADTLRLDGDIDTHTARTGVMGGAKAHAVLLYVGPDADRQLRVIREELPSTAASSWNGMLAVRLLARDGFALRQDLIRLLGSLRRQPVPRAWHC